jgi:AAA+ ATPase superfamily predicted ATPase
MDMFFDTKPKVKRSDLYDRNDCLESLKKLDSPITILSGKRRIGKTSLLKVFLNEIDSPTIYLDFRVFFSNGYSPKKFYEMFFSSLTSISKKYKSIVNFLSSFEKIEIFGVKLELSRSQTLPNINDIFSALNKWAQKRSEKLIIVFDGVQNLRLFKKRYGIDFLNLFAFIYDNLYNLEIILSSSQPLILKSFLSVEKKSSPLFGRYVKEIELKPLTKSQSIDFLKKGFEEFNVKPKDTFLIKAYESLGGVIGWLAYFGRFAIDRKDYTQNSIDAVVDTVLDSAKQDILNVKKLSNGYFKILYLVSVGNNTISQLRNMLKDEYSNTGSLLRAIKKLQHMGYLVKDSDKYELSDKILKMAIKSFVIGLL